MKRYVLTKSLLLVVMLLVATSMFATGGITINVCDDSHALIRVDSIQKYILLPIEDVAPESQVKLLVNGKIEKTINVRLAMTKVDYYAPFDLLPYEGKNVILDVTSASGHKGTRSIEESAWYKHIYLSDTFDKTNREEWRPVYHHTPEYGWMNDPNGMFYKDGVWHLCYQYGPYGSTWNNMTWGHSTSDDLIHWKHQPNVIYPDGLGTIFSGSCVVDSLNSAGFGKDAIVAMYTQADRSQVQSIAHSLDNGNTFTPYEANPILITPYEARDPHIFRHDASGKWIVVLASAPAREIDIYSSDDLIHWTKESSFGKGYGCQEGVWECPDLMELPVRGTNDKRWVLICNINPGGLQGGSATQYFVGSFDGHTFVCDSQPEVTKWMDYGKDHYAAVSWNNAPEGRHTMIAWMSNWQYANNVPTTQYRSANTLPRDVELFRGDDGELYLASLPSPEVDAHCHQVGTFHSLAVSKSDVTRTIPTEVLGAFELDIDFDGKNAEKFVIELFNSKGESVLMTYDLGRSTFSMDRAKSGVVNFSEEFPCVTTAPCPSSREQNLRLFIDKSSVEAFEGDGRFCMTNCVFPTEPYSSVRFHTEGGKVIIKKMTIYSIK